MDNVFLTDLNIQNISQMTTYVKPIMVDFSILDKFIPLKLSVSNMVMPGTFFLQFYHVLWLTAHDEVFLTPLRGHRGYN